MLYKAQKNHEMHICKTTKDTLIWQTNEFYLDEDSFKNFYKETVR